MKKLLFALLGIVATNASSSSIYADSSPGWNANLWNFCNQDQCWNMESSVHVGYINLKSTNFVFNDYNPNWPHKISQLDWTTDNLWVVEFSGKFNFLKNELHLAFSAWTKIQAENAMLLDRDFFDVNHSQDPTVLSKHPNTHLSNAYEIDIELSYDYWSCNAGDQKYGFLMGYKFMKLDWDAFGGYGFFKDQYEFVIPNKQLAISYTENYYIPYIGLYSNWNWNDLNLRVYGKYTPFAYVKNEDFHVLRSINFVDKFHGAVYWVLGTELRWSICHWLDLDIKYSYDQLNKQRGGQTVIRASSRETFDAAGIRHSHHLVALGINAKY